MYVQGHGVPRGSLFFGLLAAAPVATALPWLLLLWLLLPRSCSLAAAHVAAAPVAAFVATPEAAASDFHFDADPDPDTASQNDADPMRI